MLEGILKGLLASLTPGMHPIIYGWEEPFTLGVIYGSFTAAAIFLSERGIFHPETAGNRDFSIERIVKGFLLGIALLPLAFYIYSLQIPHIVVFLIVLLASLKFLGYTSFMLSGLMGFVVLNTPTTVSFPLASGLFYLFGVRSLFPWKENFKPSWEGGVISGFLTGWFPALPPSAWSRLIGGGDIAVAAAVSPLFSLVALIYGKTRSSMTAFLETNALEILILVGLSYILSFWLVMSLLSMIRSVELPKEVGIGVIIAHALYYGWGNVLLLLAAVSLVLLTKDEPPSSLFGFLIIPTLIYYS